MIYKYYTFSYKVITYCTKFRQLCSVIVQIVDNLIPASRLISYSHTII